MTHPVVALARVVVIEIGVTRPPAAANLTLGLLADWKISSGQGALAKMATPIGVLFWPTTSIRRRRQIQLPHPQALIGDIGGEKIRNGENSPNRRNHVLPPGQRGGRIVSDPVHLNERRHYCGTGREHLVDCRGELVSPARLIGQRPQLKRAVDRKCDELLNPKRLDVGRGQYPVALEQEQNEARIGDDGKRNAECPRRNDMLCV
jgi:hypothetical protein